MEVGVIGENGVHVHDRVKVSSLDLEHVIHRNQLTAAHDVEAAMGSGDSDGDPNSCSGNTYTGGGIST